MTPRRGQASPTTTSRARDQATPRPAAGALAVGEDPHRLVRSERGQDRAAARARPSSWPSPVGVEPRHADDDRVLDRRDLLDPQPDRGRPGSVPAGTRSATSRGRPDRFARARRRGRRPAPRRRSAIASRPSRISNGTRSRRSSKVRPAADPSAAARRVRRKTSGRWASSSKSVLGVDPAARPGRSAAGRRPASAPRRRVTGAASTRGAARPGSAARTSAGSATPATSATRPATSGTRGDTAAMIRAGRRRTWKGPKEPTRHVGVDAIAAVSVARPLRADANARRRGRRPVNRRRPPIRPRPGDGLSTARPQPGRRSAGGAARSPDRAR